MQFTGESKRTVVKKAELSLTPMIDVVFLLLIFFMVGMKFKELDRKLMADLPREGPPPEQQQDPLVNEIWVRISDQNRGLGTPKPRVVIDQIVMRDWRHTYDTLARLGRSEAARQDPVILDPHDNARHGWVMKVLDYLHQLEYKNINFRQ